MHFFHSLGIILKPDRFIQFSWLKKELEIFLLVVLLN